MDGQKSEGKQMKWNLYITFSKFTAYTMLILSFALSWYLSDPTIFIFTVPFVNFIITGKQYIEAKACQKTPEQP
jgi:hypothetical protein